MAFSIIEKALDTWEEWHGSPGLRRRDVFAEDQERLPAAAVTPFANTETRISRQVDLDLDKLRSLGIIHPQWPHTELAEEYRRIKQPLLQKMGTETSQRSTPCNLIMVTSAIAGEGKTFTALNLAISMAMERDRIVLLIDADMIKRGLSRLIQLDSDKGLADLLQDGQTALAETLLRTNVENLSVLPVGQRVANYTELVGSFAMRRLTQQLALRYPERVIIFDVPPLLGASATSVLVRLVDQIVMVVEVGKTPRTLIQEAMPLLEGAQSIGVVLNKSAKTARAKYAKYYASGKV